MPDPSADSLVPSGRTALGVGSLSAHIDQNVSTVAGLYEREAETLSPARRRLEHLSTLVARLSYLVGILGFVVLWIAANLLVKPLGSRPWIRRHFNGCRAC